MKTNFCFIDKRKASQRQQENHKQINNFQLPNLRRVIASQVACSIMTAKNWLILINRTLLASLGSLSNLKAQSCYNQTIRRSLRCLVNLMKTQYRVKIMQLLQLPRKAIANGPRIVIKVFSQKVKSRVFKTKYQKRLTTEL